MQKLKHILILLLFAITWKAATAHPNLERKDTYVSFEELHNCPDGLSLVYSDAFTFDMPKTVDEREFSCGMLPPDKSITNKAPITSLEAYDEINAGGFPITLTKVNGNGSFSGEGYVGIPMLSYGMIKVRFDNIKINTDYQMIEGKVETTYDPKGKQIANLGGEKDTSTQSEPKITFGNDTTGIIANADTTLPITIASANDIRLDTTQNPPVIVVKDENGNEVIIPANEDGNTQITDADGNSYKVNSDGSVIREEYNKGSTKEEDRSSSFVVDKNPLYLKIGDDSTIYKNNDYASFLVSKESLRAQVFFDITSFEKSIKEHDEVIDSIRLIKQTFEWSFENTTSSKDYINLNLEVPLSGKELSLYCEHTYFIYYPDSISGAIKQDKNVWKKEYKDFPSLKLRLNVYDGGLVYFKKSFGDFGFDDAQITELQSDNSNYDKETISGIQYYIPWVATPVESCVDIKIDAKQMNMGLPQEVFLELIATDQSITINNEQRIQIPYTSIAVTTLRIQTTNYVDGYVEAYLTLKGKRQKVGKIQIESKEFAKKKLQIVYIKSNQDNSYPSLDKNTIIQFLNNKAYNQVFFEWILSSGGYIDKISVDSLVTSVGILKKIEDTYLQATGISPSTEKGFYWLFLVSQTLDHRKEMANGIGTTTGNVCSVFNNRITTCIHELGHNLGLSHTFEESPAIGALKIGSKILSKFASKNFMDYRMEGKVDDRDSFFKYQQIYIYKEHK